MTVNSSAKDLMTYSFSVVFADGIIDEQELAMLERLALTDGVIDDDERSVLTNIFSRVDPEQVEPAIWSNIVRFKEQHGI